MGSKERSSAKLDGPLPHTFLYCSLSLEILSANTKRTYVFFFIYLVLNDKNVINTHKIQYQYRVVGSWRAASGGMKGAHIGLCLMHSLVQLSAEVGRPPTAIRLQITDQTTPNVVVQLLLI